MTRVFSDRLINDIDKNWFYDTMCEILQLQLHKQWDKEAIFGDKPIFCTNFMKAGLDLEDRKYELVLD
jgi:hypothetical protein